MRIFIKGGAWKNVEDEILKAAVMKYGKNQWARVASLLPRKSAKQCKARWYEWLDPSIKKTEWTREEEEKLLHLAKIFPSQWRTIAPIVGRTAAQCLEHYERLLDQAQERDGELAEDPRKLRPGEVDNNQEAKPARPDPIDMDEDEKEMLNEARARLANTKGKKAKRKAREKQLEEARRLAALQKRRELKAAGIDMVPQQQASARSKKVKNVIDYNRETPFVKKPLPGFYDTGSEQMSEQPTLEFVNLSLQRLEGKRRDDEEEQLRKAEAKKQKQKETKDLPMQIEVVNKMREIQGMQKRQKIALPSPQVSDQELEEIGKLSGSAMEFDNLDGAASSGSAATAKLLSDYKQTPLVSASNIRTPLRTPGGQGLDPVLQEAKNLAALQRMDTPLKGGSAPNVDVRDLNSVKRSVAVTPNPLAGSLTPTLSASGSATPSSASSIFNKGQHGGATPISSTPRDQLRINNDDAVEVDRLRVAKQEVVFGLKSLPAPSGNDYTINAKLPNIEVEDEQMEEDASDIKARIEFERARKEQELLKKRSQSVQRDLPRPSIVNTEETMVMEHKEKSAAQLLQEELVSLLQYDAIMFPVKSKQISQTRRPLFVHYDEKLMNEARKLIEAELENVVDSLPSAEEFATAWDKCINEVVFADNGAAISIHDKNQKLVQQVLEQTLARVKKQLEAEEAKSSKLENRVAVLTKGFQVRIAGIDQNVADISKDLEKDKFELECFNTLREMETLSIPARLTALQEQVSLVKQREESLQQRYASLLAEKQKIEEELRNAMVQ